MKTPTVVVDKSTTYGELPAYLQLAHRHLEKAMPAGEETTDGMTYRIPIDLLRISCPKELVDGIEEVTVVYSKAEAK